MANHKPTIMAQNNKKFGAKMQPILLWGFFPGGFCLGVYVRGVLSGEGCPETETW